MEIELTQRAQIALDHLPPSDQKKVHRLILSLVNFPVDNNLHRVVSKIQFAPDSNTFMGKAGLVYRVIFRPEGDTIKVLEIVHHSRLESFFRNLRGGGQ